MVTPVGSTLTDVKTPSNTELTPADQKKLEKALDSFFLTFGMNMLIRQNQSNQQMIKEALEAE